MGPQHPGSPEQVLNPCARFLGSCPQPRSELPNVCTLPVLCSGPLRAFRSKGAVLLLSLLALRRAALIPPASRTCWICCSVAQ